MGLFKATISAVRKGLGRTREAMTARLATVLRGRTLDEATIDEIQGGSPRIGGWAIAEI